MDEIWEAVNVERQSFDGLCNEACPKCKYF